MSAGKQVIERMMMKKLGRTMIHYDLERNDLMNEVNETFNG